MFVRILVVVLVSGELLAAQNTCMWADAPWIATGKLEPRQGFKGRTVTISRWLKGEGPRSLQLDWLTSRVEAGEFVLYGRRIEGDVFHSVMLRSMASLNEDAKLIDLLKQKRNVVRGRFVTEPNNIVDWRPAVVQLSGDQRIVTAKLDVNGRFEELGLPAGVYAVSLTTPPSTAVRQPPNLHVDVPERGCAEPVFVVYRNTLIDKARETLESAASSLRAVTEVVAESVTGSRR
jgi:hypothetical protein